MHRLVDGVGVLRFDSQDDDSSVRPGRIGADVAEPSVKRYEDTFILRGSSHDIAIGGTCEVLANDGVDVMAKLCRSIHRRCRNVLVELDPHREVGLRGCNSSLASSAPYATAARAASGGSDG